MTTQDRRPVSLRVSVTDRCQCRCLYCLPPGGVAVRDRCRILSFEEIVSLVRRLKRLFGLSKVHLTGGEPLLRRGIVELVAMLAREGVELALTTNGQALAELAGPLWRAGLRRINISLDSLDPSRYAAISRGGRIEMTLAGIAAARAQGFDPIKLNAVVMRGHNDADVIALARWGMERGLWVRFLELMPIGLAAGRFDELFVPSAEVMSMLSAAFDLQPCPAYGGTARYYRATDGHGRQGVIGLISSCSQPFCAGCRRLRLTASGELIGCLAIGRGIDLRPILQQPYDDERLVEAVGQVLEMKRGGRGFPTSNLMVHTGG